MSHVQVFPVKRAFLYSLILSVVLSALLGIIAILSGEFGWLELRILLTAVTISLASINGLACGAYLGTGKGKLLPWVGIVLTLVSTLLIVSQIWLEFTLNEAFWKLTACCAVYAIACAHLSLLSMARLAQWFQWSLVAAYVVILGVATMIAMIILLLIDNSGMFHLLGVAAVIDAAITILIPIFHRLSKTDDLSANEIERIDQELGRLRTRITELEDRKRQLALAGESSPSHP